MGGATDGPAPDGTGTAPAGPGAQVRPLVVCRPDGRPVGVLEENLKGFRKTIEQGHLWALHPGTGRLLPFNEESSVTITDRGTWYEAVLSEEVDAVDPGREAVDGEPAGAAGRRIAGHHGPGADDETRTASAPQAGVVGDTRGGAGTAGSGGGASRLGPVLAGLAALIARRHAELPEGSYTTHLFTSGPEKIRKKAGEEAVELLLASTRETLASETADLLYHLLVLLESEGISLDEIAAELERR